VTLSHVEHREDRPLTVTTDDATGQMVTLPAVGDALTRSLVEGVGCPSTFTRVVAAGGLDRALGDALAVARSESEVSPERRSRRRDPARRIAAIVRSPC
jgi:hypothetical protein